MQVAFRADAAPSIGGGHVMRCLTLAGELARRGATCTFLVSHETAAVVPALGRSGFTTRVVGADAADTLAALRTISAEGVDILVTDSYAISARQESQWRPAARLILAIDDLADRPHDCDILLDTAVSRTASDYASKLPPHCHLLLGTRFALLRPEFAAARARTLAARAPDALRRIVVSLGMSAVETPTARIVQALRRAGIAAAIDIVSARPSETLAALVATTKDVHLHIDPGDIAALLSSADLAIGAAGTTSWERCCLGLPSIVVVLAPNQNPNAEALARAGTAVVTQAAPGFEAKVAEAVRSLAGATERLGAMAHAAAALCDGDGSARVVDALLRLSAGQLRLRTASADDARYLLDLRNDPAARAVSRQTDVVAWETHTAWLARRLADPATLLLIAERRGERAGMVRFDADAAGRATISINVSPAERGSGVGRMMLALACDRAFDQGFCTSVLAEVKSDNVSSRRLFTGAGFRLVNQCDGWLQFHLGASRTIG
ncbi:MAG: UDP-2,4-diacetamido-2,4,6-trideoxy-beta-L-altropyranose hydrolase [Hyphomicrobiaceae bacterium]